MNNIHDFKKAIEQKQRRLELKEKHNSGFQNFIKQIIEESELHKEYESKFKEQGEYFLNQFNELNDDYMYLFDEYKHLYDTYMDQANIYKELIIQESNTTKTYSNLFMLAEHFIIKNNLQNDFIAFIKDVAKNEIVQSIREAAQYKGDFYIDDIGEDIIDEYGMLLEDEEYHQKMAELDKEEN
ncbi:hypothetical protein P9E34_14275 [Schinkia azotoformans]|uniref:hypothetical protein n=1 Tax=Schinkia azotoformans TaxID=1454 RepID=UPI002DB9F903|nr:hypothetical protein [Schinkia azotoformans]MEC1725881.1 hypothetical protein [Schinkia azotoformans]